MTEELKPCPFCNGMPQKREVNHWTGMRNDLLRVEFIHHCEGLKPRQRATLNVSAVTEEEAIEAWNRRATPAPAQPEDWKQPHPPSRQCMCPSCIPSFDERFEAGAAAPVEGATLRALLAEVLDDDVAVNTLGTDLHARIETALAAPKEKP